MYLKIRVLLLLLSSMLFYSCSDDPASIGSDSLPGEDFINLLQINPDSIQQSSTFMTNHIGLGTASRVLLGRANNNEASFLLRFLLTTLPDSLETQFKSDAINILSARVEMTPVYSLGDKNLPFDFSVYKVGDSWSTGVTADSLSKLGIGTVDLSGNKTISDTLHSFDLNTDLVKEWLVAESDTSKPDEYGIYFKPTSNTTRVVGYQAIASPPQNSLMSLNVIIEKKDKSYKDTLVFGPTVDVHIVSGTGISPSADVMILQGGLAVNSSMLFTLPKLPVYNSINRAVLQLTIDPSKTNTGKPTNDSVVVRFLTSPLDSGIHYDSTQVILLKKNVTVYEGDIAAYVQRWYRGEKQNGILISLYNEEYSMDQVAFFGSSAAAADRPKLFITYTSKD